ncbi:flagellar motor protein MotB [Nitrosomonas oligotropha]|jgi:chemotaxis protein MotB|uniref:Chemotaxis protein MotB n=1 Tax=Nitrosomonas oligotropha TaxID=42354 RepID=A0A1H8RYP7_9PROT|nr:flagellar motor protein MotB [Nitrosomonas oligotropha]MBK7492431.1 flagellar motor protein MotB [Nitrosomonas sp.]MBP9100018.1 flagellar motor protein MotB [Nitrosomonas sp.]PTQ75073.1 chemotaxis protein MotB [Nitrosomonas oligotropha]TXI29033.1 MAG: flagellar motor protein MotB [Nitrosomonas oligotropha]SDW99266.1 chemotaxis protein MotB [Nitrosomonas oligotropha]
MADDLSQRPIVIKRIKKVAGGHHGGAWKIAYADFVTAMMAFFLLMWLLGSSTKSQLEGISEYFKTPLKVAMTGGSSIGETSSILKGGGTDLTRQHGEVKKGEIKDDIQAKKIIKERIERIKLEGLKKKIEEAVENNPTLKKFANQLLLDITSDGLRIQIVDEQNRPMFALGKADLQPYTKTILREIGKMLNDVENKISLSGHTDGKPFPTGDKGYSNWELSADRANASRRELIIGGMDTNKVLQVIGLSSAVLFDKEDPVNPINRRISIVVMNEKAEKAVTMDGQTIDVDMQAEPNKEILQNP